MHKILVVDDEGQMRRLLKLYLQQDSYLVEEAENGRAAISLLQSNEYDLMILDVMMPEMDGWQTLGDVRRLADIPILMLTAKGTVKDRVNGLTLGADDYLVKPFEEEELMARVKALLRRYRKQEESAQLFRHRGLIVNLSSRSVVFEDQKILLTQTEFDLLGELLKHRGQALSREQLVSLVWGMDFEGEDRTVDSHIRNLRDKLKAAGLDKDFIHTVWGIGYKIEA